MIISPKYDESFKEMFGNETVRRYFIGDILGIRQEEIHSVRLRNTFLRKVRRRQKLGILDVLVELNSGKKINIELQVKTVRDWDKRQLFYLCKLYTEDILSGEDYGRLKQCVGISILDFNLTNRKKYHSVYRLRDDEGNVFSEMLELHIIELKKELTGQGEVDDWIRFFNAETEEDLKMIKASTENPGILEAIRELRRMSMSNPLRLRYEAYLKRVRDEKAREGYVWDQGEAKGRETGRIEGKAEGKIEGEKLMAALTERLLADNRVEDVRLAARDENARERFYREYGIER